MNSRIPSLLAPYVQVPPLYSLILITSVLGSSANWLVFQYLFAALGSDTAKADSSRVADVVNEEEAPQNITAVVLVSWLSDWTFWRKEARRAVGLDLDALKKQGRIAFVDGLATSLCDDGKDSGANTHHSGESTPKQLSSLVNSVLTACQTVSASKILLVLDHPSLVLHISEPAINCVHLTQALLKLRANVFSCILVSPTDTPLVQAAVAAAETGNIPSSTNVKLQTPLETEEAAFLIGMAHDAHVVLSCRRLGTGWAADVSGVVRATRGGNATVVEAVASSNGGLTEDKVTNIDEGEWLYHISGDGKAKIWARGSTAVG